MLNLMTLTPERRITGETARPAKNALSDSSLKTGQPVSPDVKPQSPVQPSSESDSKALLEQGKDKKGNQPDYDRFECKTCKNRKYQDGSDDPGVSFKTPSRLSPDQAASAVRSHENEHVTREQAKAKRENRQVVSQSVSYHTAACPECGQVYVSGGTTRTVTKAQVDQTYGLDGEDQKNRSFELRA